MSDAEVTSTTRATLTRGDSSSPPVDAVTERPKASASPEIIIPPSPPPTNSPATPPTTRPASRHRRRLVSGCHAEDHVIRHGERVVYTAGRPPWYDVSGQQLTEPFVIGICGGSASGKTTVAQRIIEALDIPWATLLSLDSFYKVLSPAEHDRALNNEYDFDHPSAFDWELAAKVIRKLRDGKRVEVPVYNFATHARDKCSKTLYGADVIIFEGILSFFRAEILDLMDLKIFVDTDSDIRLARRLLRDITERGRDIDGVIKQYNTTVKPSFDNFIAPLMRKADIIIPRGGENRVAIDLIVKHITKRLEERGFTRNRSKLAIGGDTALYSNGGASPPNLHIVPQTPQVRGLHTHIRDRSTAGDDFVFYSQRLARHAIEHSLSLLPFKETTVKTPQGTEYTGRRRTGDICGVSVLRAGETMEGALREVVKDARLGKILIQTNTETKEPELYYLRLPKDIQSNQVLLMDATVATGAAAMMAIRILLDHDVPEENITLVSFLMARSGAASIAYAFRRIRLVTTAVDAVVSQQYFIEPGLGNFGDRFFGTSPMYTSATEYYMTHETGQLTLENDTVASDGEGDT